MRTVMNHHFSHFLRFLQFCPPSFLFFSLPTLPLSFSQVPHARIHAVDEPGDGRILSLLGELTHYHFSAINTALGCTKQPVCAEVVGEADEKHWWVRNQTLADFAAKVRQCELGNKKVRRRTYTYMYIRE